MRLLKTIFIVSIILTGCIPAPMNAVENPFPTSAGMDATLQPGLEPYIEYNSGTLWVQLFAPRDEEIVPVAQIDLSGKAPAGTVISVNEMIALVSTDETFSFPISLDEGPNVIEFVASDVDGNEIAFVLTVIYEP